MDSQQLGFLQRAVDLAGKVASGELQGAPYTCVVVKDGLVIAEGWNRAVEENDITLHGEIDALRKAGAKLGSPYLEGCEIYASYEPCSMCVSAIFLARIKHVFYAMPDGTASGKARMENVMKLKSSLLKPTAERTEPPYCHVTKLQDEATQHMNNWMAANPQDPRVKLMKST